MSQNTLGIARKQLMFDSHALTNFEESNGPLEQFDTGGKVAKPRILGQTEITVDGKHEPKT